MGKYITKRILLLIPTFFLICVIVFTLMRLIPGDAVDSMVIKLTNAGVIVERAEIERRLGLDQPALTQFFVWLKGILMLDFGDSLFQYDSVMDIVMRRLPVTLELGILTMLLSYAIAIPCGLLCAARQDSIIDNILRFASVVLMSVPVFWLATIVLIYPAIWWRYSPPTVYVSLLQNPLENLRMFIVPALISAVCSAGGTMRLVRTTTLDVMRQDYVRTGWAKGLKERKIMTAYAFRTSLIPVITHIGGSVSSLVGGSVLLENVFNIPGMGKLMVEALGDRDYPLVQGCVIIFALFVMIVNLLVDVAYKWIDPRVTLD